jgi:hypothetical protein
MKPVNPHILTINGGSSSIKFALFESGDSLQRILEGGIERIGLPAASLQVKGLNPADNFSRLVSAPDHTGAVEALMDWIEEHSGRNLSAVATLIAVYGLLMTPLGWGWALFVWGYAVIWFLVTDRVKLLAYRLLLPPQSKQRSPLKST